MQSFIVLFLTCVLAALTVNAAPVPQPQLGGLTDGLPLGEVTSLISDPTAVLSEVLPTVEGLTGNVLPEGLLKKRQDLGGVTGILSEPTSLIGDVTSIPESLIGGGLGGGLLRRQLGDITGVLSNPTAIIGDIVPTVEGLAGGAGGILKRRPDGLLGLDIAALPVGILEDVGLGSVGDPVASIEETVEGLAGGL